jgi:hypothetical protein
MCGPAAASLAVQSIGAVTSAVGAAYSASAQKMGFKLDATIAGINAERSRDNAREAMREGYQAEVRQRLQTGMIKGAQRAAMGANNVDMTTGSAANRLVSTDYMGEADAQTIRLNAARAASGYRVEASNQDIRATMDRGAAKGINPLLTGVTSLLGSASSIASNWYGMKQSGAFGQSGGAQTSSQTLTTPTFGGQQADSFRYGTLATPSNGGSWLDQNMPIGVKTPYGIRY